MAKIHEIDSFVCGPPEKSLFPKVVPGEYNRMTKGMGIFLLNFRYIRKKNIQRYQGGFPLPFHYLF